MKLLLLGESGQLGTELRRAEWAAGTTLLAPSLDELDLGSAAAIARAFTELAPDVVLNAAAYTAVDKAESEQELAFRINAEAPEQLARGCAARGIALVHVSTDYVFDGKKQGPYRESDATGPQNIYGRSKLAGEERVRAVLANHVILRTSWLFSAVGVNFVKTMRRLARERDTLRVVADQHGRPTSARALARGIVSLLTRLAERGSLPFGTYHFACQGATTWHGLASAVVAQTPGARVAEVTAISSADYPTPAARPQNSVLDTSLFERTFELAIPPWQQELTSVMNELSAQEPDKS